MFKSSLFKFIGRLTLSQKLLVFILGVEQILKLELNFMGV